jgi:prevent-host-death family protein
MPTVSVAQIKSHLSEFIAKSAYTKEKIIITRRNKPVAALVSMDDLRKIEQYDERKGLAAVAGKWKDFDEISNVLEDVESIRMSGGGGRDVSV